MIIFVDIRGFSQWSEKIDANESTLELVESFQSIIAKHFPEYGSKPLGDGAMLVREVSFRTRRDIEREITSICARASAAELDFQKLTEEISIISGHPTDMTLGWGVTRGMVIKQKAGRGLDYLGHHVNKAARLCDLARPQGMVIDRDDFIDQPTKYRTAFYQQIKKLQKPYTEVKVWVSQEINETFQAREFLRETPEVHVAGVCVRINNEHIEVLIAKRSSQRRLFPSKWEGCGGQLRYSESFRDGVRRHFSAEMKIEVDVPNNVGPEVYTIDGANEAIIPGLRFLCVYGSGQPISPNHEETRWVSERDFSDMRSDDFPPQLKEQALALIQRFKERASV